MPAFQQYAVLFYLEGFHGRQLATLAKDCRKTELIYFIEDNGGRSDGNWYKFSDESGFQNTMRMTRELGGIVYDLPEMAT